MSKDRKNILFGGSEFDATPESPRAVVKHRPLAGLELPTHRRGAAGSIAEAIDGLAAQSKRGEELEAKFSNAEAILEIDSALIDPSFARDRMAAFDPEGADADFVAAIHDEGQLVPALLRPNPAAPGRYQPAYGRRRIAAAAFLGRKVRAVVRDLSDEQLVVAQGQENEARNGLTFIEKCRFAATLEAQGFKRKVIESALSVAQSTLSQMFLVAERIPAAAIEWIGPAPGVGRPRWVRLAELSEKPATIERLAVMAQAGFITPVINSSDDRFSALVAALAASAAKETPRPASTLWALPGQKKPYGSVQITPRRINVSIDRSANPLFAEALFERFESIRRELEAAASANKPKKG
jgi:ParB family transcriptional regulator, chromosome partitioning protein